MVPTILYALTFAVLATAQSSVTVSLFLPNADTQSGLVGSIAGADASATTYVIGCANVTSASASAAATSMGSNPLDAGCGFDQSQTITQGPSTYHYVIQQSAIDAAITIDCSFSGTVQAVCAETASGSVLTAAAASGSAPGTAAEDGGANIPPMTTATLSGSDFPPYQQVVITAGLSNTKAAGASSTGTGSAAAGQTGSATSGGSAPASSSGSTAKSSNGAMGGVEPALVMSAAGLLAVGLAAIAL